MSWEAIGAIAGPVLGSILGNEAASGHSSVSREWQGDQERSAREFSERMSSTAHQREITDLKAAGLNPILSAMGSGASSPGGSAPAGSTAPTENIFQGMSANILAMKQMKQDLQKQVKEIEAIDAQVKNVNEATEKTKVEKKLLQSQVPAAEVKATLWNAANKMGQSTAKQIDSIQKRNEKMGIKPEFKPSNKY